MCNLYILKRVSFYVSLEEVCLLKGHYFDLLSWIELLEIVLNLIVSFLYAVVGGASSSKLYVNHSIYKGKAALTVEPKAPEFTSLDVCKSQLVQNSTAILYILDFKL